MDIDLKNAKALILEIADNIISNEEYLCKLDSFVGDGDHGVTLARGFTNVKKGIEDGEFSSISELFSKTGVLLSESTGGAIGPIYGSVFAGGSKAVTGKETLGTKEMYEFFNAGLDRVRHVGMVKEGDRTMVDALGPAVESMRLSAEKGLDIAQAAVAAAKAAEAGAENTKTMVARKGRARFLGERSKGYRDAGASSMALIFKSIDDFINRK